MAAVETAQQSARAVEDAGSPDFHNECRACQGQTLETANHLSERAVASRAELGHLAYNVSEE